MISALLVRVLVLTVLFAGFGWAEANAVRGMLRLFDTSPMYSYGYLVPFISLFLVWSQRRQLAALTPKPAIAAGTAVLAGWAVLVTIGEVTGLLILSQLALVVGVAGFVLLIWGIACLRVVWAAVAYLLLMVPLWDAFTEPMHLRFQLLSANLGLRLLELVGIPAFREGTVIHLPTISLEVARACSGVNYLVAVVAIGLPLSYLYLRRPWRRVVLVTSALVIAALSNSLRVATIGVLVHLEVGAPLHGPAHVLHGLFVSAIGYVALFVGLKILGDMPPAAANAPPVPPIELWRPAHWPLKAITVGAVLTTTVALALPWLRPKPVPLTASLERLPAALGKWTAHPYSRPADRPGWDGADHELHRRYVLDGRTADLFVGYFEWQRQARELVTPRALVLHRLARVVAAAEPSGAPFEANVVRETSRDGQERVTMFWYEIDGATVTDADAVRLRTLWSTLGRRRSNGAVVSLTLSGPMGTIDQAEAALMPLARDLHLALRGCLPNRESAITALTQGHALPGVAAR